jgi:hypothetical protein
MIKQRIKSKIATLVRRLSGIQDNNPARSPFPFIQNVNRDLRKNTQPRVLISYITAPFEKNIDGKSFHTNQKEAVQLLQVFIARNFAVDICHCLEEVALPEIIQKKYDVVFGFGKAFAAACKANPKAIKIMYCTEAYPDFVKKQEQERLAYYHQRYGKEIQVSRHGKFYLPEHFLEADYLLYKGNHVTGQTFATLKHIKAFFPIAPAPFVNHNYQATERNIESTKKNFVWFGSYGAVHKGLDILVDIFNEHPEWQLSVCGLWKEEIPLLPEMKNNIKVYGFMDTSSEEFIDLVNSHSFVVLSTCSEGMSSGVLTCMVHGLIPLVSHESGIDLNNKEQYFEDFHLKHIEKKLLEWTEKPDKELLQLHHETFEQSRRNYNLEVFTATFDRHLQSCLQA